MLRNEARCETPINVMVKVRLFELLKNSRDLQNWHRVGMAVAQLLRLGGTEELRQADAAGVTRNQLLRLAKTALFVDRLAAAEPQIAAGLRTKPFSHVETITRIWRIDSAAARRVSKRPTTHRKLLAEYSRIRSSGRRLSQAVAGKETAKNFRALTLSLLQRNPSHLFDHARSYSHKIVSPGFAFAYANPDFLVIHGEEDRFAAIDAIDCYCLRDGSDVDVAMRRLIAVATECTFFDRFWVVLPAGQSCARFASGRDELGLDNVGVICIEDELLDWIHVPGRDPASEDAAPYLRPQHANDDQIRELAPSPDRRKLFLRAFLRRPAAAGRHRRSSSVGRGIVWPE